MFETIDPARDAEIVETELVLADLEVLERAMEKRDRDWRTHPTKYADEKTRMTTYKENLEQGIPLRQIKLPKNEVRALKTAGLLSGKPVLFVANATESDSEVVHYLQTSLGEVATVALDVGLELELQQFEPDERREFMAEMGLERPGLEVVVEAAFELLGLIRFYTVVKNKLQAWEVETGTAAAAAAGKIHSDMEAGFVRAKIVSADDLIASGDLQRLQSDGRMRVVGKDHEVQDGDVIEFLFTS
jgi:ribosome-binding ATPase YchF (GTP1/OBG family)